ncbi:DEAD/DEAH box helicase [Toxoplasma gondii ME49]|uniref:RNA helicase n=14 Tax=Toxoplasma gondii TaxID=5811 RepID=B6KQ13_TOXGV|nr:DEAD/DEAH box helicase [Toxoplasma gondii ME49]EPR58603.1 DEAD/DEAH box helicase [Toxoplasma gondii GT1]ESS28280.1 DEAD/DEAH box helicase [Toxoplasma gondii VEG]KAF4645517.1 DEAD/DEAH box helicase [Toxoplasma gondii]KFG32034.1 DEAD/DEAH box helicase [Toxoplasma gondii FOU]KFG36570.1 DEAD/DEAH box helicase [Toxoplasma gondii p89]KFG41329.1 DEAD/DEAH box helicase [Toxoplasma gondii GAB2-2007-GAL-DOM2]KFG56712.1 DEAD/DEAH box helicase [Toxoplasma gondii RUB]KFH01013.1 DEAD/DEAH box helicase|eukprot:XP_002369936.1 DEAD/DEAH box helicase [Toxoplasma gondii ME49]
MAQKEGVAVAMAAGLAAAAAAMDDQIDQNALQAFMRQQMSRAGGRGCATPDARDAGEENGVKDAGGARATAESKSTGGEETTGAPGFATDFEAVKHKHLREVDDQSAVVVDRADGSSGAPVSASSWTDLNLKKELLLGVENQGFSKPSKIQAAALPLIFDRDENLIAQAQNGSGKTATFALAMLTKVDNNLKAPQALCLCPTRELAQQTVRVIESLARFTDTSIFVAIPQKSDAPAASPMPAQGTGKCKVYTTLTSPVVQSPIVVGTPGKCMELLKKRKFGADTVKLFVLDEADELINFSNNMAPQVQQIRRFFPQRLQILLFSATFSEEVRGFAEKLMPTANKITVKKEELTLSCIKQYYIPCDQRAASLGAAPTPARDSPLPYRLDSSFYQKFAVLSSLYSSMCLGQSVIFVNSRRSAFSLALKMQEEGYAVSLICGTQAQGPEKMGIEMRDRIMDEFRKGETKVLICTDVLARGIDVPQVTLVVNFDLPLVYQGRVGPEGAPGSAHGVRGGPFGGGWEGQADGMQMQAGGREGPRVNMETYIHRIGRTGRFGLKGIAINLVNSHEEHLLQQIRDFYRCDIECMNEDPEDVEEMIRKLRI